MAGNSIHDRYDRPALFDLVGKNLHSVDLLDLGGSIGEIAVQFVKRGANVTVADIDHEACELAKSVFGSYVRVEQLDLRQRPWPFLSDSFDVIVASLVLDLVDDLSALDEAARVLRPDGRFIVSVPHPDACGGSDKPRDGSFSRYGEEVIRDWFVRPVPTWKKAFSDAGLRVTRTVEPVPPADEDGVIGEPWIMFFELMAAQDQRRPARC